MVINSEQITESEEGLELGFHFHPAQDPLTIGHPQLDIHVYSQPTGKHFDPAWVRLPVTSLDTHPYHVIITHPWGGFHHYQIGLGRIILRDHTRKVIEAFTLGGTLDIEVQEHDTTLMVKSSAPILATLDNHNPIDFFIIELESILAEIRAALIGDDLDLEHRLVKVESLDLFRASLLAVESRIRNLFRMSREDQYQETLAVIHQTMKELRVAGQWPKRQQSLTELLEIPVPGLEDWATPRYLQDASSKSG